MAALQVILRDDVPHLGKIGDVVVKPGFARNSSAWVGHRGELQEPPHAHHQARDLGQGGA
jgi:hypothetical protein